MPTGYTNGVGTGKVTSLRDYALLCARAFGATVMMRDDPLDAPIPEEFKPSTEYHDKAIAEAKKVLSEIPKLSDEESSGEARKEFDEAMEYRCQVRKKEQEQRLRYQTMLELVRGWTPPSSEHQNFKKFMEEQLTESIRFDCPEDDSWRNPVLKTGVEWRKEKIEKACRDIAYHEKELREEISRTESMNLWIKQLRESLAT